MKNSIPKSTAFRIAGLAMMLSIIATAVLAERQTPVQGTFDLSWKTVANGGGRISEGGFELTGTIGQHDATTTVLIAGGFSISGGFWPGIGPGEPLPPPCPPDIAPPGGNGIVNVDDLLAVINSWGTCPAPPTPCPADIAPAGGNGFVNVDDLLVVINGWGPCP